MPTLAAYDYAVVRVVPRVERGEFLNVGVIVSCESARLLEARIELDEARLRAFDATLDLELLREHLAAIPRICAGDLDAGPIAALPQRARFNWLTAKRSTIVQTSPVHRGQCATPADAAEHLLARMVRAGG
jgi:hypothetical protein